MAFDRELNDFIDTDLNKEALRQIIALYNNESFSHHIKGWVYAIRNRECLAIMDSEGKYDLIKYVDDNSKLVDEKIEIFLNEIENAIDITAANQTSYRFFEIVTNSEKYKFRVDLARLKCELKNCGLSATEIKYLSLKDIILIGSAISTIDYYLITPILQKPFQSINDIFHILKNSNAAAVHVRRIMGNLESAQNNMLLRRKKFYEYIGENFIRLKINPPGVIINDDSYTNIQTGYHSQGLPFQIIIKMNTENDDETNQCARQHIISLIDYYAEQLSLYENPKQIIQEFHLEIESLKNILDFKFVNLMISYEKDHQVFSIDFSLLADHLKPDSLDTAITYASTNIRPIIHSRGDIFCDSVFIPTEIEQRALQEKVYKQESMRLAILTETHKAIIGTPKFDKVNHMFLEEAPGKQIQYIAEELREIEELKKNKPSKNLVSLTRNLASINRAIENPSEENCNELVNRGHIEEQKSDLWKSLGKIMKNIGKVIVGINTIVGSFVTGIFTGMDTEQGIDKGFDLSEKGIGFFSGRRSENQKVFGEKMENLSGMMRVKI